MANTTPEEITGMLLDWGKGDRAGARPGDSSLLSGTAAAGPPADAPRAPRRHSPDTALVNEAYLRLVEYKGVRPRDRAHFLASPRRPCAAS
ncbi:MAG: hypothetical protein M3410_01055 [Acidobacteriota bacterium]|nr:hypothetical protein [Acidobacteriota bacterium]